MTNELLTPIIIVILSTFIFFILSKYFKWNEKVWLYLNFIWLFSTVVTIVSFIPEVRKNANTFSYKTSKNYIKHAESNIQYIKKYAETYSELEFPSRKENFGPDILWNNKEVQETLRNDYIVFYNEMKLFRPWAIKVWSEINSNTNNQDLKKIVESFSPTNGAVKSLTTDVKRIADMVINSRIESEKIEIFIEAKEYKRLSILLIMILLPFALGIPIAHNIVKIRNHN